MPVGPIVAFRIQAVFVIVCFGATRLRARCRCLDGHQTRYRSSTCVEGVIPIVPALGGPVRILSRGGGHQMLYPCQLNPNRHPPLFSRTQGLTTTMMMLRPPIP